MTDERKQPWYVQPRIMLPLVSFIILITVLATPEPPSGGNDQRLTTYSTRPPGARMFYELAQRLGWNVERTVSAKAPLDSSSIFAVLAPPRALRGSEVHELLEHVRGGGALLAVTDRGAEPIADSLGLRETMGGNTLIGRRVSRACPTRPGGFAAVMAAQRQGAAHYSAMTFQKDRVVVVDTLLAVRSDAPADSGVIHPVIVGLTLGKGRVVLVQSTQVLRNDVIRNCPEAMDVQAIRALEYLAAPGNRDRRIIFDEYHQGFGAHSGSMTAILTQFGRTREGRVFYQLAGAGIILLLAAAPRALPPRELQAPDRRSPLEHVDALARAYHQVGATKTATQRLVHGLRRRVDRGVASKRSALADEQFLRNVEERHAALHDDVALVREALAGRVDKSHWVKLPRALDTIEHTLTRT